MKKVFRGFSALSVLIAIFVVGAIGVLISKGVGNEAAETVFNNPVLAPSPVPFGELTIPYLRQREYKSSLGSLTRISQNSNYASYLTSYDSDGLKINGLLTQPQGESPAGGWPAIVFVHGYIPPQQYKTAEDYASYVDYLAKNGFVVFKIDLRGHADSEGEPGGAYYSSDYVIDVLNARAALLSSDFVKGDAIGLWGHSMAGNVVFRSLAAAPEIPAVVIWAGAGFTYSDLAEFGIDDNSYQPPVNDSERQKKRRELFDTHGEFDPNSAFWKQVVPTNYISDLKGAIQLNHAANDPVVSIEYSRNLNKILSESSVVHELNEYPDGGHNISGAAFAGAMENTRDFFRSYLR
ncbi:MAG: alpha/beta fold hydrolase [Candidatus Curtissbacteria bacterium]